MDKTPESAKVATAEKSYLRIVEAIYAAAHRPRLWTELVAHLSRAVNAVAGVAGYYDINSGESQINYWYGVDEKWQKCFDASYYNFAQAVIRAKNKSFPLGVAVADHHLWSGTEEYARAHGKHYQQWFAPQGFNHFLGSVAHLSETEWAFICFHRNKAQGQFSDKSVSLLNRCSSHMQRAVAINREFTAFRSMEDALKFGFEQLLLGVVFLDSSGRVCYKNPMASSLLNGESCISINKNRRLLATGNNREKLQILISDTVAGTDPVKQKKGVAVGLQQPGKAIPLLVYVRLLDQQQWQTYPDKSSPQVIVLLSDPDRTLPHTKSYLQNTYGMTATESEIAVMVGNGMSIKQIATARHTTLNTIRAQLKHVFQKTGVNRQGSLVKILLSGPFQLHDVA